MQALFYGKLFIYLLPFNFLFGEYNAGIEYRAWQSWSLDVNAGYINPIQGSQIDTWYQDIFNENKFYYQGAVLRISMLSLYPRGVNPFRTDYNQIMLSCRLVGYDHLDFVDDPDTGKVFNLSEHMQAIGLSWIAGYNLINTHIFKVNAFIGFGLQGRFRTITTNSYGYNFNSSMYPLAEKDHVFQVAPLVHIGLKAGFSLHENQEHAAGGDN